MVRIWGRINYFSICRQTDRAFQIKSQEKRPFSMISIAFKKEQMMFEVLLPLQIDLALGL